MSPGNQKFVTEFQPVLTVQSEEVGLDIVILMMLVKRYQVSYHYFQETVKKKYQETNMSRGQYPTHIIHKIRPVPNYKPPKHTRIPTHASTYNNTKPH